MSPGLKFRDLIEQLEKGKVVAVTQDQWSRVASHFPLVEDIDTRLAGRILLVQRPAVRGKMQGWAIVEDPAPGRKVIRPLKNEKEARALIADRLAAYERMWDG